MSSAAYLSSADASLVTLGAGAFTLTFWFRSKATGTPYVPTVLFEAPAWKLTLDDAGTLSYTVRNSVSDTQSTVTSGPIVDEDWNFCAVLYDPDSSKIYLKLNGVTSQAALAALADSSVASYTSVFQLGTADRMDAEAVTADFDLDETAVWGRLLSDTEIAAIYASGVGNIFPFFGGYFNLIFQGDVIGATSPIVAASSTGLWSMAPLYDSELQQYQAQFTLLDDTNEVSRGYGWEADNFNNKIVLAQHDNFARYWVPGTTAAYPLPGLPSTDAQWDGVMSFYNHVLLWKDDRLKWSDVDDFATWIPVSTTAVSTALTLAEDFVQPPPGGNVSVAVVNPVAEVKSISIEGDLAFGDVAVGSTGTALLTIVNSGTTALAVTGVSLPDGFSGSYAGVIPVGGSVPVVVTFTPTAAISYDGAVTVASDATLGTSTLSISGTGTGLTKTLALSGVLTFGSCVKDKTLTSALVLTNTGTDTVTVSSITYPTGFSGAWSGTIAAGATQIVSVTFAPTTVASFTGHITVNSDSTSTDTISISGTSVSSLSARTVFLTDNGTLQFGKVASGGTATGTLRIYNPSSTAFNIVGLTVPAGFSSTYSGTVAAYSYVDVSVSFSPTSAGDFSGLVYAAFDTTVAGTNNVLMTGTGTVSGKVLSLSGNLAFGEVPTSGSVQALLKITNTGTTALTITSISYPTGFSGSYAGVVNPGDTKSVLVAFSPTSAIDYSGSLTVNSDADSGTNTYALSGTGFDLPQPLALVEGQFVRLADTRDGVTYYNFYTVVSMSGTSLVLKLQDLTGATATGLTIPADGRQLFTVDANEAGETQVTGAQMNGAILKVIQLGDYAFIFKSRAIASLQYTGLGNGTFFVHREVVGEGLLSRRAVVNRNDGTLVFLGHKDLYLYQGGPTPIPVCRQTTLQMFAEIDRARLDAVQLFHNENAHEIWVKYPVSGGFRVLIWNYIEDSSTLDDYDAAVEFTALSLIDWTADVVWQQLSTGLSWSQLDTRAWEDWVAAGVDHVPVLASQDGNIRVFGQVYDRDGDGYLAISETQDYDLGEPDIWKYVDTVVLGLQVLQPVPAGATLAIQVGSRPSLNEEDEKIVWTAPKTVLVDGTQPVPVKVNPGGAGRYLRLRFSSSDPGVRWRVSSFELHCRPGGLY